MLVLVLAVVAALGSTTPCHAQSGPRRATVEAFRAEPVFWKQADIGEALVAQHDRPVLRALEDWLTHDDRHIRANAAWRRRSAPATARTVVTFDASGSPSVSWASVGIEHYVGTAFASCEGDSASFDAAFGSVIWTYAVHVPAGPGRAAAVRRRLETRLFRSQPMRRSRAFGRRKSEGS
jgi:hypothetical protein